ncbi:MAG: hypothetical protein ACRDFB_02475, partial [Rhabdochlamydiaceae bacterium]
MDLKSCSRFKHSKIQENHWFNLFTQGNGFSIWLFVVQRLWNTHNAVIDFHFNSTLSSHPDSLE